MLVAGVLLLLTATPGEATSQPGVDPLVLTAVADIGTVYWRHNCPHGRRVLRYSLGVRIFYTATTRVVYRAGRATVRRTLQPEEKVWFPLSRARYSSLSFAQPTEPGTLRARVLVDWRYKGDIGHCYSYFPPRFTVQLYPRGVP